ncbi:MAG: endonuclease domain-containing protein [Devosia sp.]
MRSTLSTEGRAKDLRRAMTQPERTLWAMLRRNQLGLHFRRQHPLGPYILDFYCAAANLCIEIDGPSHEGQASRDAYRTRRLAEDSVRVIRFTADDVERRPAWVIAEIVGAAAPSTG